MCVCVYSYMTYSIYTTCRDRIGALTLLRLVNYICCNIINNISCAREAASWRKNGFVRAKIKTDYLSVHGYEMYLRVRVHHRIRIILDTRRVRETIDVLTYSEKETERFLRKRYR